MTNVVRRFSQRGFTLIEIGIVLLIAAAIVFAAVRLGGTKTDESKANTEATMLSQVFTDIRKAAQAGATVSTTQNLIDARVFPTNWVSGSTVTHGFGGALTAAAGTPATTTDLTLAGVPSAGCQNMVPVLAQNPATNAITVAGTVVRAAGAALNYATMSTQCNSAATVSIIINVNTR